jgi:hypothetical protein
LHRNRALRVLEGRVIWRPNKGNKSGFRGVSYNISNKRYQAAIYVDGRQIHLGYFATPELAHDAYSDAVMALEFDQLARTDQKNRDNCNGQEA